MATIKNTDKNKNLTISEELCGEILNFLPLPFCLVNSREIVLKANSEFCRITNYSLEEIVDKKINLFFEEKRLEKYLKKFQKKATSKTKKSAFSQKKRKNYQ